MKRSRLLALLCAVLMFAAALSGAANAAIYRVWGDVDRDGFANISDLTLVAKSIAQWNVELEMPNADLNCDGLVNISDLTLLAKSIAQWDVTVGTTDPASHWEDYDALIEAAYEETDAARREALLHLAEEMLMETGAVVPLYDYTYNYLLAPSVSGCYMDMNGIMHFQNATTADNRLSIALGEDPWTLDPAYALDTSALTYVSHLFSGLTTIDEQGRAVVDCARDYAVSEDGLTYTFTLREGLVWSDGTPLDANDFVYSWNRAFALQTDYSYLFVFLALTPAGDALDISASADGSTLTVRLAARCPYAPYLFANPVFFPVPRAATEALLGNKNPDEWAWYRGFVCNGAYTVSDWQFDASITLQKNDRYHRADEVRVPTVEGGIVNDDGRALYTAYRNGDMQLLTYWTDVDDASVRAEAGYHEVGAPGNYYFAFNVKAPLFDDMSAADAAKLRCAISLCIDRERLVRDNCPNNRACASFVPATMQDGTGEPFAKSDAAYTYPTPDGFFDLSGELDRARSLLVELGYTLDANGKITTPISFPYLCNEGAHEAIAQSIREDLARVGIEMTIEICDWQTLLTRRQNKEFTAVRNGWIDELPDPFLMLTLFTTGSPNNDADLGATP